MKSLALAATLMMAASGMPPSKFVFDNSKPKEPKNKFKLTPEQIEAMQTMSPKEKKKFLKALQ